VAADLEAAAGSGALLASFNCGCDVVAEAGSNAGMCVKYEVVATALPGVLPGRWRLGGRAYAWALLKGETAGH
jgi:hypothetical protein